MNMGFSQLCEAWIMEDNPNHDPSNGEFSSGGGGTHSEKMDKVQSKINKVAV